MRRNIHKNRNRRSGFTLLEVMVVLFILVTLAALAVGAFRGQQAKAQRQSTLVYVKLLASGVERYTIDMGRPPTTEQGLSALLNVPSDANQGQWGGPYLKDTAKTTDPWGNPYQYACPGKQDREFDVWSFGPDGMDSTEDDIGQWVNE